MQQKTKNAKRILIKIGTSTITSKQKINLELLYKKSKEIAGLKRKGKEIIIITSGAVGAGMEIENLRVRPTNPLKLQLLSGKGQVRLMKLYKDYFKIHNIQVAQVLLTHHNFDSKDEVKNIKDVVRGYLKEGTIPIINTNDVVTKEELAGKSNNYFSDNDELAALVSEALDVDLLLMLTDVDGLCTKDPRKNKRHILIKQVNKINKKIERMAAAEGSMMGLGGMLSKVLAAKRVGKKGIVTIVANGRYRLDDILGGRVNRTVFVGG